MPVRRQPVPISSVPAPAGCQCRMFEPPKACLTCTCPDCGATGRYGVGLVHRPTCTPEA